jgi:cytosine/adenosine deaminase-related metal-dependent hydrolase
VNYAHANEPTDAEYDLIAASGGSISICPSVDMLMALGTYPATGRALSRGIAAGLSVDTTPGTGTDLFTEMRVALAAERSRANAGAIARGGRHALAAFVVAAALPTPPRRSQHERLFSCCRARCSSIVDGRRS